MHVISLLVIPNPEVSLIANRTLAQHSGLGQRRSVILILARIFHECRRETVKMASPPGNPAVPRDWIPYLNSTSQGEPVLSEVEGTPEDARSVATISGNLLWQNTRIVVNPLPSSFLTSKSVYLWHISCTTNHPMKRAGIRSY